MHEYYAKKTSKLKKAMNGLLKPISGELNKYSGKPYAEWNTGRRSLHRARDINKIAGNDLNRYPRIICILRRMSKRSTPKGYSAA